MQADIGTLTPEQMLQQQQILRQQKMAEMLMQKGMEQPQGQMISGHYVRPSIFQNLAGLANTYVGQKGIEKGDQAQIDLAKAIREQKMGVLENINQALDAGDLKKARGIATANPEYAGQFAAPLIANAIPKAATPTPDIQNFEYLQKNGQIPKNMTLMGYQKYLKQHEVAPEKAPAGYRFMADGSLEPIKGGPADLKTQAKMSGAGDVSTEIVKLKDSYDKLYTGGGITDPSLKIGSNLAGKASSSDLGQSIGSTFGTKNATERDKIAQTRPLLMGAIMKATGMSAKQIDSNAELKLWLSTATDPKKSYEANMEALNNLENLYGVTALDKQSPTPINRNPPAANAGQGKGHWEYRTFEGKQQRKWVAE